jgi:hypothetical protein
MSVNKTSLLSQLTLGTASLGIMAAGSLLVGVDGALAACPNAANGEPSLESLLTDTECQFYVEGQIIDLNADELVQETFSDAQIWKNDNNEKFWLEFEFAGFAADNIFGIYDANDATQKEAIFTGVASPVSTTTFDLSSVSFANNFGFYLASGNGKTYYSQSALNGGAEQALIYAGNNDTKFDLSPNNANNATHLFHDNKYFTDLIIAFEDLDNDGGRFTDNNNDFNDSVVYMHGAKVPEPATALGLSLVAGAFGLIRKRDRN